MILNVEIFNYGGVAFLIHPPIHSSTHPPIHSSVHPSVRLPINPGTVRPANPVLSRPSTYSVDDVQVVHETHPFSQRGGGVDCGSRRRFLARRGIRVTFAFRLPSVGATSVGSPAFAKVTGASLPRRPL